MKITPNQIRAARKAVGWNQRQLAEAAGVGTSSVERVESGRYQAKALTIKKIIDTLREKGVRFSNRDGRIKISFPRRDT